MNAIVRIVLATGILAVAARAQQAVRPMIYNNLDGDGSVELDQEIKEAYAHKFTIMDTSRSEGYSEPTPTAGSLPDSAKDKDGRPIVGYVRIAYIVTADGLVAEPVVLKTTDSRLDKVAIDAMRQWRFSPGMLRGVPVPTTAAQEFNFGGVPVESGFTMDRLVTCQTQEVLLKRLPGKDVFGAYVERLRQVAHNFFVGIATPDTLQIVIVLRPALRARVWFVSSTRAGDSSELEPLRRLLEGVPPVEVREGPVAFALCGRIGGGDGKEPKPGELKWPVPKEWSDAAKALQAPLAVSSDGYLNLMWREAK